MVIWKSRKAGDFLWLANALAAIVLVNLLAAEFFFRADLTEEKRYTIKPQTKQVLKALEEDVYVEVFLEGELNAGFRRLRKNIEETLEEFRVYSGNRVKIVFTDPTTAIGENARNEFMKDLAARGIQPTNVTYKKDGQRVEKIIFPGAVVSYGGIETGVMLLKGNKAATSEEVINQSVEGIEYELANAIYKLANNERGRIGFVTGHGELDSLEIASFNNDLLEFYDVFKVDLRKGTTLSKYNAIVVAKPLSKYEEREKYRLDQYVMNGGRLLLLLDRVKASIDSASRENYFAVPMESNLDDLLFRYGVRINPDLVQDQQASLYPVVTGQSGGKPQVQLLDWPYYPLINSYPPHPVTRNLDAVLHRFASSIDTVKAEGIRKTPLMLTSPYSKISGAPVHISINNLRKTDPGGFTEKYIPTAYLLEGSFTSLFRNRFLPEGVDSAGFKPTGKQSKIIVVSDGDLMRNEINPRTGQPQPLGFDPFTNYTFANREFLLNALSYLTQENGLIQTRTRQVILRPLDKEKIASGKTQWQIINLGVPLVLLVVFGIVRSYLRKRKYARF